MRQAKTAGWLGKELLMFGRSRKRRQVRSTHSSRRRMISRAAYSSVEAMEGRILLSFTAPVNYSSGSTPTQLLTADFNGNGTTDVIQLNQLAGTVGVSMGNGDGTFQPQITTV